MPSNHANISPMVLRAPTPRRLGKIRVAEGWPRIEGDGLSTIRRAKSLYNIKVVGNSYVAERHT